MCHELDKGRVPEGFEEMLRYLEMIQIQYLFQLQIKKSKDLSCIIILGRSPLLRLDKPTSLRVSGGFPFLGSLRSSLWALGTP